MSNRTIARSARNVHKQFSTLELSSKGDCLSNQWNTNASGKVKGGVFIRGTLLANSLICEGNLTVNNGNINVSGTINGNLIGDYITPTYQYVGRYTGNIKGTFSPRANVTIIDKLEIPNKNKLLTPHIGNCITNITTSTLACANNNDTLIFKTNNKIACKINNNGSCQTGQGVAKGTKSYSEGNSTACGKYSHSEGLHNVAGDWCHVEGGNCTTEQPEQQHLYPMFVAGYENQVKATGSVSSESSGNVEYGHIHGINNYLHYDGNSTNRTNHTNRTNNCYNHIEGESNKVTDSQYTFVTGYNNLSKSCESVHIEGKNNKCFYSHNSHIEGSMNTVGNVTLFISDGNHVEGTLHYLDQITNVHVEGCECTTNNTNKQMYTRCWAGGKNAKINQNYEWVRSSGKIDTIGDAQTGIYTLHRTQTDNTPVALGIHATSPTGIPDGVLVMDGSAHIYDISIVGRTSDDANDWYSCDLLVIVTNDFGKFRIEHKIINENSAGHFVGKPNLISVGTIGVSQGTFSLLMDAKPVQQTTQNNTQTLQKKNCKKRQIFWAASVIGTQVSVQ